MTELIGAIVGVRDGLTLIAFLSMVLLLAFRTKQVPEMFFGLVRDKLTRDEFARLLRRFMILGFVAFLALVALAVLAQVLAARTQPGALTIDDLRQELAQLEQPEEVKVRVEAQFHLAQTLVAERDLDGAIAALQASIEAVPTRTAEELLASLYRQRGDHANAAEAWGDAMLIAREQGDAVAQVRLDRTAPQAAPPESTVEGETDLIGNSTPLPAGGDRFETATPLEPGLYACGGGCFDMYYVLPLESGTELGIRLRSPPDGGLAGVIIYGTNGQSLAGVGDGPNTMRGNAGPPSTIREVSWTADVSGPHYLRPTADGGTVYRIRVQ